MKTIIIILILPAIAILWMTIRSIVVNHRKWNIYEILKGRHYSKMLSDWWPFDFRFDPIFTDKISFIAMFSKGTYVESEGVNKLYGLGWGIRGPMYNSYRIGWKYNSSINKIDLYQFVGQQGKEIFTKIGNISIATDVQFRITFGVTPGKNATTIAAVMTKGNEKTNFEYVFDRKIRRLKYRLFPYFGGTDTAPNDVRIMIRETL